MVRPSSMDLSRNVDHAYDQYLAKYEPKALQAITRFQEKLQQSFVKFGRFTIPSFLKAYFITPKQEKLLKSISDPFYSLLNKATSLYFTEPELAGHFRFTREMEELIKIDPGLSRNVIISRFDGFLEGESLKFLELNCDSPSGMGYGDMLEQIIFESELLGDFFKEFPCKREERSAKVLSALLSAYEEFGGYENPTIAIVDWRTVRTKAELESLKIFFEGKGYKTTLADPRDLRYKGGKLYHGNFKIDLVYRRVAFLEVVEKLEELQDFLKAYRDRAICMVNPLRAFLATSKAVLSFLTNPAYMRFFTDRENQVKREHLPWTRRIADAENFYGGHTDYLIDFLKDEKDSLVLKPAEDSSGRDVIVGSEARDEDWNLAIDKALKSSWVVQEFVAQPKMTVPVVVNGKLDFAYKKVNLSVFVCDGKFSGGLSRLSDETVINVSRGGGLIPLVASEETVNR